MSKVVELVKYKSRETAQVLQCLADMALRGEVTGIAICYRTADRQEHAAFTGAYRAHPQQAAHAAMRLSIQLTQEETGFSPL